MRSYFAELEYIYVTTTGRKTGRAREIEIWFVEYQGRLFILAEHFFKTQWVLNIANNPSVKVRVAGVEYTAMARILDKESETETWIATQRLAREKYGWGDGLPVELTLDEKE